MPHPISRTDLCHVKYHVAPVLTSSWALHSRVVQAPEYFWSRLRVPWTSPRMHLPSTSLVALRLRGALARVVLKPFKNNLHIWGVMKNRTPYRVAPRVLGWLKKSVWGSILNLEIEPLSSKWIWKINHWWHVTSSPETWIQVSRFEKKNPKHCGTLL